MCLDERVATGGVDRERAAVGTGDSIANVACHAVHRGDGQRVTIGIGVIRQHIAAG